MSERLVVDMPRFRRLQFRAKRSQEVLVFGTIPSESVSIPTPSIIGGACCLWPFDPSDAVSDCASRMGISLDDTVTILGSVRPHKDLPSGAHAVPDAMEQIRPLCGANDGLSLVKVKGREYLLKRAKPNVEDDEMLSAAAMKMQLQACWTANAIHAVVTGQASDLACWLYEYEAYFMDFKDPLYERFTWPDSEGSVCQVWQGSFLLFLWPETLAPVRPSLT